MLTINVISIVPDLFTGPLSIGIPKRAAEAGLVHYNGEDLRAFATDKRQTVDDSPSGGGPGMVMKPAPLFDAVESVGAKTPIVLLSPRGKVYPHADAVRFAEGSELTLLPGAMSDIESARTDSFYDRGLSAPSYTRPAEYRGHKVSDVLLSGNHAEIDRWRREEGERLTRDRRVRSVHITSGCAVAAQNKARRRSYRHQGSASGTNHR